MNKLFDEDLKPYVLNGTSGCESITDLYVIGTAGMRVLSENEQESIYTSIQNFFNNSDYWKEFKYDNDTIMTIPGYQEAIYAWFAVYNFYPDKNFSSFEIGGGSAQLAFIDNDKSFKDYHHYISFNGTNLSVFSVSWISLGIDSALLNLSLSIAATTGNSQIKLPCYPKGVKLDSIHNVNLDVEGTGNYDECKELLSKYTLIQNSCKSSKTDCIFEGVPLPHKLENVFGISVLDYPSEFFRDHNVNGSWPTPAENETIENIDKFGKKYCSMDWDDILDTYGHEYSSNLINYCAQMAYGNLFLETGLHISPDSKSVVRNSTIDGTSINWAYGVILAKASLDLTVEQHEGYFGLTVAIGVVVGLIIVSLSVYFIIKIRKSREESDDFIPLQSENTLMESVEQEDQEGKELEFSTVHMPLIETQ